MHPEHPAPGADSTSARPAPGQPDAPFGRTLTAMVTPFTADGALDTDAAAALAAYLVDEGRNDGLVISGTTGESPTTTDEEKIRLLRAVLDAVGDRATVVTGVGTNDTAHSIHLARESAAAGAHALLVVTPYYSKPTQAGLIAHLTAVADATDKPVMLYDIPGRTATPLATETLYRVGEHPRIVAVKDAKGDLLAGAEVMARTGMAYYSGDDPMNLAWLCHGAAGVVSVVAHAFGPEYAELVGSVGRGDLESARKVYAGLIPAVRGIMSPTSQGAIRAKAAMQLLGVLPSRAMRLPLLAADDIELDEIRAALTAAGREVAE